MDMYQKREMRKINEDKKSLQSTSINWYIPPYGKSYKNPYK